MSITLTREALSCTRPDMSTLIRVSGGRPTVTFLDKDGHEIGSWWPTTGEVLWHTMDGDAPMPTKASTADEAAEILRPQVTPDDLVHLPLDVALCMGLTKALGQCQRKPMTSAGANVHFCHAHQAQAPQVKASRKKASRKTPSVTPVAEVRPTRKESTMTTTPSNAVRITALEKGLADLREGQSEILALLRPTAPAKAAPKAKAPVKAPAKKAAPTKAQAAKAAKSEAFVAWVRETAEARAARKATNADLAKMLRDGGMTPNGAVWTAAKAGETNIKALRKIAKADGQALKTAK